MKTKVCPLCKEEKPLDQYHKRPERPCGVKPRCKDCSNAQRKGHYAKEKESGKLRIRGWARQNIDITYEEYSARFIELGGRCEICFDKLPALCVDHNHMTGAIRGLLCTPCNLAISSLKESTEIMLNAIKYIQKYEGKDV